MSSILDEPGADDTPEPAEPTTPEPEADEPEPQAAEAPEEGAPEPEGEDEPPADKMVPLSALNEARQSNRQMRDQMNQMQERIQRFEELKNQLDEQRQRTQAQQEAENFQNDPLGSLRQDVQKLSEQQREAQERAQQMQAQQQQLDTLRSTMQTHIAEFSGDHPDYQDALSHLLSARGNELRMMGVPEAQIPAYIDQESVSIANAALQNGRNAAEMVYELAKLRGYSGQSADSAAAQRVQQLEKGQQASQRLPSGSADESGNNSIDAAMKMDDAAFDAWWEKEMKG